jgi:hypothetical protein
MRIQNKFLDTLAGSHTSILCFDCEFWRIYGNKGYHGIPNTDEFFMPREIGGFYLTKNTDGSWEYHKHFFVTLSPPDLDISFISSQFATVSQKTAEELDIIQASLVMPWASAYKRTLPEEQHAILEEGINSYLNDPNIKKHHKTKVWYKKFLELYSNSLIVVKGKGDIEALENACRYHKIPYKNPLDVFDIADWNKKSHKKCGTARLEGTYTCILNEIPDETGKKRHLREILPLGEAHDPSSDAAMTLLVALYIISVNRM